MCVDVVNAAKRLSTPVVNDAQRDPTSRVNGIQRLEISSPTLSGLISHLCHLIRRVCASGSHPAHHPAGCDSLEHADHGGKIWGEQRHRLTDLGLSLIHISEPTRPY